MQDHCFQWLFTYIGVLLHYHGAGACKSSVSHYFFSWQNVICAPSICQHVMNTTVPIKTIDPQSAICPKLRLRVGLLDWSVIRESHRYAHCFLCVVGSCCYIACQVLLCPYLFLVPGFTLFAIFTLCSLVWCIS